MHEEIRYPVCPYRNVSAAYQRFFGPDSGGIERFFPNALAQRTDGTLLIVRARGKRAFSGAVQALEDLNGRLSSTWTTTVSSSWGFAAANGRGALQLIVLVAALLLSRPQRLPV